jgi:hypothetical protein
MKGSSLASVGLVGTMILISTGTTTRAQDLDEVEERPVAQQNVFELHESNFEQWVFGTAGRANSARDQLDSLLMLSVGEVERSCNLSEAQRKKLLLAGHGDIKHFMDRVAEARRVFDLLRRDQNNINEIYQETVPLSTTLRAGLFGSDSFFSKTIGTTLEPEQEARYRKSILEKNQFRYRAKVRLAINNLDNAIGFSGEERQRLTDLVLEETKPPIKPAGQYETQVVLLKIARIPEAKIRPIFDEARWKLLIPQFQQARGMEAFLKTQGFLDEPEPAATFKPIETKKD